jgi:hypothetical protein
MSGAASSRRSSASSATSISPRKRRRRHSRSRRSAGHATVCRPTRAHGLTITARNRAIDRIRRDATLAEKTKPLEVQETAEATMDEPEVEETSFPDERLELIFTCCHPALALEAQWR